MANTFTASAPKTTMTLNGTALIESGSTTSAEIPNSGRAVIRLGFPTITSTTVTFQVQAYPASGEVAAASFRPLVDKDGNAVSYTIGSDKIVTIPELSGCAAFKFVLGSAEGADRTIEVTSRGDNPVVSPTEVDVNIESGATITANQGTKTATATNGWLVSPYTQAGVEYATANLSDSQSAAGMQNVVPVMEDGAGTVRRLTSQATAAAFGDLLATALNIDNGTISPVKAVGSAPASYTGAGVLAAGIIPANIATATPTVDASTAAEDNRVVKASAGTLYGFTAASTTAQYIQIFNLTAVPASGAGVVPFLTFPITANGTIAIDFGVYGIRCSTGIVIANSTTFLTYTDGGDDTLFNVQYV